MKVTRSPLNGLLLLVLLVVAGPALAQNQPPVAENDDNYGWEAETLTGDVSLNDSDPNGDILTYSVVTGPPHGSFTLQPNGQYSYTPDPEFNGFIYITIRACDPGGLCDESVLELAFLFVNDPPVIVDDVYYVNVNTTLNGNVTDNDYDIDIEPIFATVLVGPVSGTLSMGMFGNFTYTPPPGFIGTVTFTYKGCDPCEVCGQATVTIHVTAPNLPPVANDDDAFTSEHGSVSGTVATNDSDPEGMTLTFSLVNGPQNGEIIFNSNGTYTYTPDPYFYGFEAITYTACDPFQACATAILVIEVIFVNDPPVIVDDFYTGPEDQPIMGNAAENDFEYDIEPIFYSVFIEPESGTIEMYNDGYFTYIPEPDFYGVVTVVYFGVDPCGVGNFATITFTITPVNDPPVAVADVFNMQEDGILPGDVSLNDTDIDSADLTYTVQGVVSGGTLNMNDDGSFIFTPDPDFFGTVTAGYEVCDDFDACASSTVTIQVAAVNDAPVAEDDSYTTDEDVAVSGNVGDNDHDVDDAVLTYSLITPPANGVLVLQPDGSFTYTPVLDDSGVYTAVYQVSDGHGGTDQGTITLVIIGVNDALEALNDSFQMQEDGILNGDVSLNDSDPDGDELTYSLLTLPTSGTLIMNADGTFTYTPGANYFGTQNLSVQVCDAPGSCEITTLSIQVLAVNDAPVAVNDTFSGQEDQVISGNVATNDFDVDSSTLTYTLITGPVSGTLNLGSGGSFSYTPTAHFNGTVSFVYQVCDNGPLCATATATINVISVNDVPVALDDSFTTPEEVTLNGNVSLNDSDADGEILAYSVVTAPASGALTLNGNGTFTYVPVLNFYGVVTFVYNACDAANACDQATVTITVTNVNDAPIAVNDSFTITEDGVLGGSVALNDSDPDGGILTYSIQTGAANGIINMTSAGSFSYSPAPNYNGLEQIIYNVCDAQGLCDQGTLFITVVPVNDPPVVNNESVGILVNTTATGDVSLNDSDVDHPTLTYTVISGPENGTLTMQPDGTFEYVPFENFSGPDIIVYQACDALGACDEGTLTIEVINNNVPPVAVDDNYTTLEEFPFTTSVAVNDSDENGGVLIYSLISPPLYGEISFQSNGVFTYEPELNFWGTDAFVYQVCDAFGECDQALVTITVEFVNDDPILVDETYVMDEDDILNGNVGENDIELDFEVLIYTVVEGPFHGVLTLFNDGYFTYVPDPDFYGTDYVVYSGCDPCIVCDEGMMTIEILPVNDTPVAQNDEFEMEEDGVLIDTVADNDADVDGDELTYSVVAGPQQGEIAWESDGSFTYIPAPGFWGQDSFVYEVCDPDGLCVQAVGVIVVSAVNDTPVVSGGSFQAEEDVVLSGHAGENDYDPDNEELHYTLLGGPQHGELTLDEDGHFTYTPDLNFSGSDSFIYEACDAENACGEATVTIEVLPVNDAPVVSDSEVSGFRDEIISGEVYSQASDVDNEVLSFNEVTGPQNGVWILENNGTFAYTPDEGWTGTETITYDVCDDEICVSAVLTIHVIAPNEPPVVLPASLSMCKGTSVDVDLTTLISDAEENVMLLDITQAQTEDGEVYIDNANKILTFIPDAAFEGVSEIEYTVCDNGDPLGCASAIIEIAVEMHEAPEIVSEDVQHVSCYGANNGQISVEASGVGELIYDWDTEGEGTFISQLAPGEYHVVITDQAECGQPKEVTYIVEGPAAPLSISGPQELTEDGEPVLYEASGGTEPYAFSWSDASGEVVSTSEEFGSEEAGAFVLTITDANGCQTEYAVEVLLGILEQTGNRMAVTIWPNPVSHAVQIKISGVTGERCEMIIYDVAGRETHRLLPTVVSSEQILQLDVSSWPAGVYHVVISSGSFRSETVLMKL